jgi:hypothetical protein
VVVRDFRITTQHGAIEGKTLSEAEKNYLETLKIIEQKAKKTDK